MRSVKRLSLCLALLACAIPARAQTPAKVQTCKSVNGGTAKQLYTVTIASSGGTTGCASAYTSGNAIIVAYHQLSGSDRTTSNISATGATITWHKAASQQNIAGPWNGIFYACGGDITSPTSSIAITVDMGASMAGISATYVQEAQNIQQTSCLDKSLTSSNCCGGSPFTTTASGTLSSSSEYIFATGDTESGTNPVLQNNISTSCTSGNCWVMDAIDAQGSDNQSGTATAIESVAISSNATGEWAFRQSPAGTFETIVGVSFIAGAPPATAIRHRSRVF